MPAGPAPYRRADLSVEERVRDLLSRMTLGEKIAQLHQGNVGDANPNNLGARANDFLPTYGSYIVGGPRVLEVRNAIQRRAVEESRLGIPVLFGADVIHGWRAIVPIPLAQACTWNLSLIQRGAAMAAKEAHAQGVDWTFAPMIDHCVDPRWGRIAETFGESPYASSVFAAAAVRGYQGERLGEGSSIAACLKHYVGYGASEGGRDYSASDISAQSLWENHLPSFEAGVKAGARSVMSAFNDLNGVPASANHFTLTEVLRKRWGFTGVVVSDWNSVLQLIQQGFASDEADAVGKAIDAGVDLDMADGLYVKHLTALVGSGRVSEAAIDEAVRRVLRVKFELGLFEHPFTERSALTEAAPASMHLALAEEMAAASIVLLKNENVLPLAHKKIALIGPLAENSGALLGSWAQQGRPDETPSIAEALRERLPAGAALRVERGCLTDGTAPVDFSAALALARDSDVVVLALGEESGMSGENASRATLRLAGHQEELALAIASLGKPVVLVIVSGRPIELHAIEPKMAAVIAAWQGGSRAGAALADLLTGRKNPAGRLAVTWPRTTGQIPIHHQMRPRARAGREGAYQDLDTSPLYAFGHGLSYTTFSYSPIRLAHSTIRATDIMRAEVTVTNSGSRPGVETVPWFIRDPAASVTRPLKELKHFEQAMLEPGASRVFTFEIKPARDLSFPDSEGHRRLEAGEFVLFAGAEQTAFRLTD